MITTLSSRACHKHKTCSRCLTWERVWWSTSLCRSLEPPGGPIIECIHPVFKYQFYLTFFQLLQHHELFHAGLNRREYCCTMQSSMTRTKDSIKDCKFFFKELQVLSAHYLDKHQVDFTYPFVCNECDMDFIFEEALFNHQKIQHSIELR